MITHLSPPLWTVSTGSHRRWKWPLWWTLCRTVSPRSPSAWSVCSSYPPARSCICRPHTPQPRQETISRAFFTCPETNGWFALCRRVSWAPPQTWSLFEIPAGFLVVSFSVRRVLLQPVEPNAEVVKDASICFCLSASVSLPVLQSRLWFPLLVPSINLVTSSLINLCVQPPTLSLSFPLPPSHTHTDTRVI